jgi:N-acetylneuraminic acid mutarotase
MKTVKIILSMLIAAVGVFYIATPCYAQSPWTQKEPMPVTRAYHTSEVMDNKIYLFGGVNQFISYLHVYDPETDTWTRKANMPTERSGLASCVLNGEIYVMGGIKRNNEVTDTVEVYNPVTDTWNVKSNMITKRDHFVACVVNEKIYAIGGGLAGDGSKSTDIVEEYDPVTDTWTTKSSMPSKRGALVAGTVNDKIYIIGGSSSSAFIGLSEVAMYDPVTDTWTKKRNMPTPRWSPAGCVLDGQIYVIGGEEGVDGNWPCLSVVEVYYPENNQWSSRRTAMPTKRRASSASVVDGIIYVMGGAVAHQSLAIVEAYDPSLDPLNPYLDVEELCLYKNPAKFILFQNYPNPFNPSTTIRYTIPKASEVTLAIYDLLGREIETLVNKTQTQGEYSVIWNGQGYPSGIYICQLNAGDFTETRKLVLQK